MGEIQKPAPAGLILPAPAQWLWSLPDMVTWGLEPKDKSSGPAASRVTLDPSRPLPQPQFSHLYSGVRLVRTFGELVAMSIL